MTALPGETELKLWLRPADAEAFASLPRLRRARPQRMQLRTIYFDTPDFSLAGKGVALRVRKIGRRWLQTLKTEGGKGGGLSQRLELETPVSTPMPDFSRLPKDVVDGLVRKKWRTQLAPVYETRFQRTTWNLRTPDGGRVEVALDMGEILSGKKSEALCEVELELKAGPMQALYVLAQVFAQKVLLLPFDASKAERGTRLALGKAGGPAGATPPRLGKGMPACVAYARIVRACLAQLQANFPGLLQADDPEYLHQARVAVRRLRSATALFGKICPPPAEAMQRMAELGRALGVARDWDVFVLYTLPALLEKTSAAEQEVLKRRAQAARREARKSMLALAGQPRVAADLLALHRWLDALAGAAPADDAPALLGFAGRKLAKLHADVLAGAAGFVRQTPEQRHALRIRVKRLRYALDYLGDLFGGQRRFAACFARLQDELGELNDAGSALRFLQQLNKDMRLVSLSAQLARALDVRMQGGIREISRTLEKFSGLPPPWVRDRKAKKEP